MTDADENVSRFYKGVGWETDGDSTEDAKRFEDLREHAKEYVSKCRLRVLEHIPDGGENLLDMASGPIQYPEYLEFSKSFRKRYCVDLSKKALNGAREKIGAHGEYLHGNFLDMDIENNFFVRNWLISHTITKTPCPFVIGFPLISQFYNRHIFPTKSTSIRTTETIA